MYILDTNVISAMRRPERRPTLITWLRGRPDESLYLSVVTIGEIERGIVMQSGRDPAFAADLRRWVDQTITLFADRVLPFDAAEARIWGQLTAKLGHGGADLLIAATALSCGGVVVTENIDDFTPTGVRVENPF